MKVRERATAAEVGLLCEEAFLGTMHLPFVKTKIWRGALVQCAAAEQL